MADKLAWLLVARLADTTVARLVVEKVGNSVEQTVVSMVVC